MIVVGLLRSLSMKMSLASAFVTVRVQTHRRISPLIIKHECSPSAPGNHYLWHTTLKVGLNMSKKSLNTPFGVSTHPKWVSAPENGLNICKLGLNFCIFGLNTCILGLNTGIGVSTPSKNGSRHQRIVQNIAVFIGERDKDHVPLQGNMQAR